MRNSAFIHFASFAAMLAVGFWIGSRSDGDGQTKDSSAQPLVQSGSENKVGSRMPSTSKVVGIVPIKSLVEEALRWRRKLELMPPGDFPALLENEFENAVDHDRASELMKVWRDRDPVGYGTWASTQPNTRALGQAGYGLGIVDGSLMVAKTDLEKAWSLAKGFVPGGNDNDRWNLVRTAIERHPETAMEFVRKHRDALSISPDTYGAVYGLDPMKLTALSDQFPAGPVQDSINESLARYYVENPTKDEDAGKWFQTLPPDSQSKLIKAFEKKRIMGSTEEQRQHLLEVWKRSGSG